MTASRDNPDDIMATNRLLNHLHMLEACIVRFIERDKGNPDARYSFPIELRLCVLDNGYGAEDVKTGDIFYRDAEHRVVRMRGGTQV